jgi:quinol monooxygenase YgiN
MAEEVTVVAIAKIQPDHEERALELLRGVIEASHAEEGCVKYTLHHSKNEPGAWCIVERWRSQADLDAHFGQPHMAPMQELFGYLSEPPAILFCEPIPAGDAAKGSL